MIQNLKRHFRTILFVFMGVAAFASGVWWVIYADYLTMIHNRYLQGPVTSYMGVNLGDTRAEVLYKNGKPPYVFGSSACKEKDTCYWNVYDTNNDPDYKDNYAPKTDKDFRSFSVYVYTDDISNNKKELAIKFDNNNVKQIICRNICQSILGISIGTLEDNVYRLIGHPDSESIDPEFGNKKMIYKNFNLTLTLEKRVVYAISVKRIDNSIDL